MRACHRPLGLSFRSSPVSSLLVLHQSSCTGYRRKRSRVICETAAEKRFTVIGAGLAGLATAYHLQKLAAPGHAVHVDVYDAAGIGSGGSGAAAGLLHPFTPKGKLLWKAEEAMSAALELLEAAEAAAADNQQSAGGQISWHTGMIRAAPNAKQSQDFWKVQSGASSSSTCDQQKPQQQKQKQLTAAVHCMLDASVVTSSHAQQLVPGINLPVLSHNNNHRHQQQQADATAVQGPSGSLQKQQQDASKQSHKQQQRQQQQQQRRQQSLQGWEPAAAAALHIPGGITLHPQRYMNALFAAANLAAAARSDGSTVSLHIQRLHSLKELITSSSKQYDAVVMAAGAAVGSFAEFAAAPLPLSLCQGYTLDMVPTATTTAAATTAAAAYGSNCPSILGSPYLASQGGDMLVVGATKVFGWTAGQAAQELGRKITPSTINHNHEHHKPQQPAQQQENEGGHLTMISGWQLLSQQQQQQQQDGGGDQHRDHNPADVLSSAADLLTGAAAVWPPVLDWQLAGIRSGVRAIPPRTQNGSVPLLGRWNKDSRHQQQQQQQQQHQLTSDAASYRNASPPVWLVLGLGARGLVYHAWLGRLTAAAVLQNDEQIIRSAAPELLAWREEESDDSRCKAAGDAAAVREAD